MSGGLNRVMLLGNLGQDPELRQTGSSGWVLKIRLATSETYLDKNKVRQERTEWHTVTVWGKRGEALAKILSKGSRVFIEGGLRTNSYDDRDGNKRYSTEIVAHNVVLCGGGRRSSPSPAEPEADDYAGSYPSTGEDDDIPF